MRWYEKNNVKKAVLLLGATLAVYLSMKYILPAAIPFLLGGLLAVTLNPFVERVVNKTGRGRGMVSMLAMGGVLILAGAACFFAGRTVCT